jgi:glucose-1-phosphate adenylyltransferase
LAQRREHLIEWIPGLSGLMSTRTITAQTRRTIAVILGGGRGTRLHPLTKYRAKPAVPVGGKYRLIDIPISNCINSGLERIYVLTQFLSSSLNRHVNSTYQLDQFSRGFVTLEVANQSDESSDWFQGTSDAVRRTLKQIVQWNPEYVLILPGDTIFRMDLARMLAFHAETDADITIALHSTPPEDAPGFGIITLDKNNQIRHMAEKPKKENLAGLEASPEIMAKWGMSEDRPYLASMGVYIFKTALLEAYLRDPQLIDFGHHILPAAVQNRRVMGYVFNDYWEDIGTIRAFFQSSLDLSKATPPFSFWDAEAPIYTHLRFLPATRAGKLQAVDTMITEGCTIGEATIENCMLGIRSMIGNGVKLRRTVVMGADYYEAGGECNFYEPVPSDAPKMGIGDECEIENAIIDKNARVGAGCRLLNKAGVKDYADPEGRFYIREGIIIVPQARDPGAGDGDLIIMEIRMPNNSLLDYIQVVVSALTPLLVLCLTAVGWKYRQSLERKVKLEERLRDDRVQIYNQILEPFIMLLTSEEAWKSDPKNKGLNKDVFATQKMLSMDYRNVCFKMSLMGSDKVVLAFNNMQQFFYANTDGKADEGRIKKMMEHLGTLLLEIRRNMGNETTRLENWDMLEWFMKDAKRLRNS